MSGSQADPQKGALCRHMSDIQPGTLITSLPSDSIVLQVRQVSLQQLAAKLSSHVNVLAGDACVTSPTAACS